MRWVRLGALILLGSSFCCGMGVLKLLKTKQIEQPRSVPKRSWIMGWVLLSTPILSGSRSCSGMGFVMLLTTKLIEPPRSVPKRNWVMARVLCNASTLLGSSSCIWMGVVKLWTELNHGMGAVDYPNPIGFEFFVMGWVQHFQICLMFSNDKIICPSFALVLMLLTLWRAPLKMLRTVSIACGPPGNFHDPKA